MKEISCCTEGGMSAETEMEHVESGGSAEDQNEDSPTQPKYGSAPEFLSLSRCTHCYNLRWGDEGESSSSAEDSGSEVDWESEAESRSSCSKMAFSEILEDAAEAESGGKGGDRGEMSEIQEAKNKKMTQRAPLIKSSSLPNFPVPHLTPLSLLPRPRTVVSTLHLQVLSQKQDNNDDIFCIVKQQLSAREEEEEVEKTGGSVGGGQRTGLPWQQWSQPTLQQHQLSYQQQQQQQQQPQRFSPLSAQCQRSPPPPHTLPVPCPLMPLSLDAPHTLHTPCTNLHAPRPRPCWYCYRMYFPYMYGSN